jgi:hypothetical protein
MTQIFLFQWILASLYCEHGTRENTKRRSKVMLDHFPNKKGKFLHNTIRDNDCDKLADELCQILGK